MIIFDIDFGTKKADDPPPEWIEYQRRIASNMRPHCLCGRFAKPGHPTQMNLLGEYEFSVHCKEHGEVWIS